MCTAVRFTDAAGNMFFGRNLDWTSGYGEQVVVTPAAAQVPAAFERHAAGAAHAVIGMGIIEEGIPLYFDCGNEKGLAIAGLNFPHSTRYAECPVDGRTNVAAYEFPFWVARNFASLAELRAALEEVTVVAKAVNEQYPVACLHWIVADATGSIVVECLRDGAARIWEDDVDVLANEPEFGWHRQNLRNYLLVDDAEPQTAAWGPARLAPFGSGAGMQGIPGDYCSPARFVKAAFVNSHYPVRESEQDNVTRLFRTLGSVAVPVGCARMPDGSYEHTVYTSCFSAASRTYYHATYECPQVRAYPLDACDLSRAEPYLC